MRQLGLFLLSMVVPSVVLVALGVRMIAQQDELADKHASDQRRLLANEFERALGSALDRIRLDQQDPAVVLVATLVDDRLVLPWDSQPRDHALRDAAFDAAITRAEREELVAERFDLAASQLQTALRLATTDQAKAYTRLLRARVLVKAERLADAAAEYRILLTLPESLADEDGVPFALYAADRLVRSAHLSSADREAILRRVSAGREQGGMPPAAWYLLRAVDDALRQLVPDDAAARARRANIAQTIAEVEQSLALQRDVSALSSQWKTSNGAWLPYGAPLWLVGATAHASATGQGIVAVRADRLAAAAPRAAGEPFALVAGSGNGEWLGERFPGLRVRVPLVEPESQTQRTLRRGFYGAALAILLSVTLFGGYLLWRDVDREMRIATLRSQFVSSVSHELKTPLTAIRMFAETLQLDRVDSATRVEYLDTIVNESERLTRLLNNVLDFSKIEEGRKAYRREATSLADVVRVAARTMAYPLEQHGFALRVHVDDALPAASIDADALEQAILNLLTNAMKYSGSGRVIDLRLARDGPHAVVSVRDEGIGIPLADQARIFEKFYRVATPENLRIPGTGLGLTLVDHIVKAHDGSITVESEPGRGSLFSIFLPLSPEPAAPMAVEAAS
jgi:signal transduction histidine kinase